MIILAIAALVLIPLATRDPAPNVVRSKSKARNLECERITEGEGERRFPGQIVEARARGDYVDRNALVCHERLMPNRAPRDEAFLNDLHERALAYAMAVEAVPTLRSKMWMVEAFHPNPAVAEKLDFATKDALLARGFRVSDRAPTLAAGDMDVLVRMEPSQAYPAACERYFQNGSIDDEVLLALVNRDPRETVLHLGVCHQGGWQWLR